MHRSVLVMNLVVCTKFHGYRPNFEAEKRIIKVGPEQKTTKTTRAHMSRCYVIIFIAIYEYIIGYQNVRSTRHLKIITTYVCFFLLVTSMVCEQLMKKPSSKNGNFKKGRFAIQVNS